MNSKITALVCGLLALSLLGCESLNINTEEILPDKTVDYKKEKQAGRNLEVPPDLTTSTISDRLPMPDAGIDGSATYSAYANRGGAAGATTNRYAGAGVLPQVRGVQVVRYGDERWLLVQAPPEEVWARIVDFWQENGILLAEQDPSVGIMRTSWLENRADISSDIITDTIRSLFSGIYDAGTRDQYRIRLEPGAQPGTTEVYLTHFGMEEQVIGEATPGGVDSSVWQARGRDPGLEAEMLRRIMIYLGLADDQARFALTNARERREYRSQLVKVQDGVSLRIAERFSNAWRLTGLALDRVGFAVEDRDRSQGLYYVRYVDPTEGQAEESWLSKLAFWDSKDVDRDSRYQVKVQSYDAGTVVTVHDEQGLRAQNNTAERILSLIHEQIR